MHSKNLIEKYIKVEDKQNHIEIYAGEIIWEGGCYDP